MIQKLVTLVLLAWIIAVTIAIYRKLSSVRRRDGRLPRAVCEAQRFYAWLPIVWFLSLGTMALEARVLFGEWPTRIPTLIPDHWQSGTLLYREDPNWPDPYSFWPLSVFWLVIGIACLSSWVVFVPLALHTRRENVTPRLAGMPTYFALQAAMLLWWFQDPGGFADWAASWLYPA